MSSEPIYACKKTLEGKGHCLEGYRGLLVTQPLRYKVFEGNNEDDELVKQLLGHVMELGRGLEAATYKIACKASALWLE